MYSPSSIASEGFEPDRLSRHLDLSFRKPRLVFRCKDNGSGAGGGSVQAGRDGGSNAGEGSRGGLAGVDEADEAATVGDTVEALLVYGK